MQLPNNTAVRYKSLPNPLRVGVIHYYSHAIFARVEVFSFQRVSSASYSSAAPLPGRCPTDVSGICVYI